MTHPEKNVKLTDRKINRQTDNVDFIGPFVRRGYNKQENTDDIVLDLSQNKLNINLNTNGI